MKKLAGFVIYAGICLMGLLTGFSLLTPIFPPAEMINHFRPFMLLGIFLVSVFCIILNKKALTVFSIIILTIHLFFAFTSWLYQNNEPLIHLTSDTFRKQLITFNINFNNSDLSKASKFLSGTNADIIVFQEITPKQDKLLKDLRNLYPHQLSCAHRFGCNLAILSKIPWIKAETRNRTDFTPPAIIATFKEYHRKYTVIGTHIAWPFQPDKQVKDLIWLEKFANSRKEPLIIAGDFNHTPWSWRLTRFAHSTGLRRHGTFGASWPAGILFPAFLIDNIFSSKEVINIETWTGPDLNSDHLPVISIIEIK